MDCLTNAQQKAVQIFDLVEVIQDTLDTAGEYMGATKEINKGLNLVAILLEQVECLQDYLDDYAAVRAKNPKIDPEYVMRLERENSKLIQLLAEKEVAHNDND